MIAASLNYSAEELTNPERFVLRIYFPGKMKVSGTTLDLHAILDY